MYGEVGGREVAMAGAAARQIRLATMGYTLSSVNAEKHDPDMLTGAINNRGAYLRAAYWQAVGSRILQARGKPSAGLTAAASAALAKQAAGGMETWGMISPAYWYFRPDSDSSVQQILSDAAVNLDKNGVYDVAQIVRDTASPGAIAARQAALEGTSWYETVVNPIAETLDPRPNWMKQLGVTGTVALAIGIKLVAMGLVVWIVRKTTAPRSRRRGRR